MTTLWPFPIDALRKPLKKAKRLIVVEASAGQLEDELRLALSRAGIHKFPEIESVRRMGGILPQLEDVVRKVRGEVAA